MITAWAVCGETGNSSERCLSRRAGGSSWENRLRYPTWSNISQLGSCSGALVTPIPLRPQRQRRDKTSKCLHTQKTKGSRHKVQRNFIYLLNEVKKDLPKISCLHNQPFIRITQFTFHVLHPISTISRCV